MKILILINLLTIFALTSCRVETGINLNDLSEIGFRKITNVIEYEKKKGSEDITPDHYIGLDAGIYPNKNNFSFAIPKTYKKKINSKFVFETDYYFTAKDSIIKVVLYQWDYVESESDFFKENVNYSKRYNVFQKQFNKLKVLFTKELGDPIEINIEQNKLKEETFRDDIKWSKNGKNVYLFMFGNSNGYRQIRVSICAD